MAIGRISGPMLLKNLERQGIDLAFDGDLIYLDVTNRYIGINTMFPNVALDVVGSANVTANLFIGDTVQVGNLYTLPTTAPDPGQILVATGGPGPSPTYWAGGLPLNSTRRRKYEFEVDSLVGYANANVILSMGVSSIVYGLTVSRPVKIEVFSTKVMDEPNPYTFIATPDHLTDDGTVILNDGSSFQSRQYSIWANLEDPPEMNVYMKITSLDSYLAGDPVRVSVFYFPAVTDSGAHMDVVLSLPTPAYIGKMVYNVNDNKIYVYGPLGWFPLLQT